MEMADSSATTLDPAALRAGLGLIPTSVVVITTRLDGTDYGATVGSFASVSLDPPLAAFFLGRTSDTLGAVRDSGAFVVNVLTAEQTAICMTFAGRGSDKFAGLEVSEDDRGQPCLPGVIARLHCDVEAVSDAGDHEMVMGRVHALDVLDADATPLVFWGGGLNTPAAI